MHIHVGRSIVVGILLAMGAAGFNLALADSPSDPATRDLEAGAALFSANCASCHGDKGHGVENRGVPLRTSEFVRSQTDAALVTFIKRGRSRTDPKSRTEATMPARGDNPVLADGGVRDIVAFMRVLQEEAAAEGEQMPDPIPVASR